MRKICLPILICLIVLSSSLPSSTQKVQAQANSTAQIQLEHLRVVQAQEHGLFSNGDEPYFVVIGFRSRFKTPNSTSTTWSGYLTELGDHMNSSNETDIPPEMGKIDFNQREKNFSLA